MEAEAVPNEWVTLEKAEQMFGWTRAQIHSKIARHWDRGVQWALIDGRRMINWREVDLWITQKASGQEATESRSGFESRPLRQFVPFKTAACKISRSLVPTMCQTGPGKRRPTPHPRAHRPGTTAGLSHHSPRLGICCL